MVRLPVAGGSHHGSRNSHSSRAEYSKQIMLCAVNHSNAEWCVARTQMTINIIIYYHYISSIVMRLCIAFSVGCAEASCRAAIWHHGLPFQGHLLPCRPEPPGSEYIREVRWNNVGLGQIHRANMGLIWVDHLDSICQSMWFSSLLHVCYCW